MLFPEEPLITHTFKGHRFADHGLDIEVLPELVTYQKIVLETAKELWRRNNPDRQRLRRNIDDEFQLKIFNLQPGSVTVPICRKIPDSQLFVEADELDTAVELVRLSIENVENGMRLPPQLPRNVVPLFAGYGRTLRDDEYIEQTNVKSARLLDLLRL